MIPTELTELLVRPIAGWENEVGEFKTDSNQYPADQTGGHVSAIANDANLRSLAAGRMVFRIDNDRNVVCTGLLPMSPSRHSLKRHVNQPIDRGLTLSEICKLPDVPIDDQKQSQVHTWLTRLPKQGAIKRMGATGASRWQHSSTVRTVKSGLLSFVVKAAGSNFPKDSGPIPAASTPSEESQNNRTKTKWPTR